MFLVGLTGGIGSGKSTVAAMLRDLGCPIIDADQIAKEVVEPGKPAWHQIRQVFGSEVLHSDGTLNRARMAEIIFNDSDKRQKLNHITHPQIYKAMVWQIASLFLRGHQFAVLDTPLLYETGKTLPYMKYIIVVYCSPTKQMERLKELRGYTEEEAERRIAAQIPLIEKKSRATHVIDNEGSLEELRESVLYVQQQISASNAHWKIRIIAALATLAMGASTFTLYRLTLTKLWR